MDAAKQFIWISFTSLFCFLYSAVSGATVIPHYQTIVQQSRINIQQLLLRLEPYKQLNHDQQVAFIASQLADAPYIYDNGMGEGDWMPDAEIYQAGAVHLNQYPVYRTDTFNCQTFVQVVMALLYSSSLDQFDQHILKIAYGAAGKMHTDVVHFYNRNHFADGDFNPVNEQNGFLRDVTAEIDPENVRYVAATLTRQEFFLRKMKNMASTVQVLDPENAKAMTERLKAVYAHLTYPYFNKQRIHIAYLPKAIFAEKNAAGDYVPNQALLNSIPTPALAEIVYDPTRWSINAKPVREVVGSELTIAHFGVLYKQTFHQGELIYQKIVCGVEDNQKTCTVTPEYCMQQSCSELMFTHATDAYPKGYWWYKNTEGAYSCSRPPAIKPAQHTTCNRVERIPFFSYLTSYQFGSYWYMNWKTILGVHIEKIV